MHQGLVGFPSAGTCVIAGLSFSSVLHSGTTTSRKSAVNDVGAAFPQRHHSAEIQTVIRMQVDALLKLGVIEEICMHLMIFKF
jgi:hypothetical protein